MVLNHTANFCRNAAHMLARQSPLPDCVNLKQLQTLETILTPTSCFPSFLQITRLKIDRNPFAKGFRDSGRNRYDKYKYTSLWSVKIVRVFFTLLAPVHVVGEAETRQPSKGRSQHLLGDRQPWREIRSGASKSVFLAVHRQNGSTSCCQKTSVECICTMCQSILKN